MYLCLHVCIYACMQVCMYILYMYACVNVCMCVCTYRLICIYVCNTMYLCIWSLAQHILRTSHRNWYITGVTTIASVKVLVIKYKTHCYMYFVQLSLSFSSVIFTVTPSRLFIQKAVRFSRLLQFLTRVWLSPIRAEKSFHYVDFQKSFRQACSLGNSTMALVCFGRQQRTRLKTGTT